MKKQKQKQPINIFLTFAFFCFCVFLARFCFLALSSEIDGINMKEFADNRSVYSSTLLAKRGNIFDSNGVCVCDVYV